MPRISNFKSKFYFMLFFNTQVILVWSLTYLKIFLIPPTQTWSTHYWGHGLRGVQLLQSSGVNFIRLYILEALDVSSRNNKTIFFMSTWKKVDISVIINMWVIHRSYVLSSATSFVLLFFFFFWYTQPGNTEILSHIWLNDALMSSWRS